MSTTLAFKDIIDLPEWRPIANAITTNAIGMALACDLRNNEDRHPLIYYLTSNTALSAYNVKNDDWTALASPALTGTFGAGATAIFHPSQGPRGTISAGTTTSVTLSTALPAAVGINQLANRGDGRGFRIRIIGNHAGGSGKTEEAIIIANGSGTTPVVTLDRTLTFTPAVGDTYEILSGRVFLLGAGANAAGQWKYYDIATNSFSGSLSVVNLPATIGTDSALVALSELYTQYVRQPSEGFVIGASTYDNAVLGCLSATASAAGTLTGQAAAGDVAVAVNQFRNFQIRIVEDTGTPTAVGQRRKITSHTVGPSPVYTLASNWTVTPSATARFVIENNDDQILLFSSAVVTTFCYTISTDTWDASTTFASRGSATGGGVKAEQSFGIVPDVNLNAKNSMIYSFRGGSSSMDVLDIAAGANGVWAAAVTYGGSNTSVSTGSSACQDPVTNQGRYMYVNITGTQRNMRFDMLNRTFEPFAFLRYAQSTVVAGEHSACTFFIDGATKVGFWLQLRHTGAEGFEVLLQR